MSIMKLNTLLKLLIVVMAKQLDMIIIVAAMVMMVKAVATVVVIGAVVLVTPVAVMEEEITDQNFPCAPKKTTDAPMNGIHPAILLRMYPLQFFSFQANCYSRKISKAHLGINLSAMTTLCSNLDSCLSVNPKDHCLTIMSRISEVDFLKMSYLHIPFLRQVLFSLSRRGFSISSVALLAAAWSVLPKLEEVQQNGELARE